MPDDDLRREIIDGELFVTPAPFTRHQRAVGILYLRIATHLESHGGGEILLAPCDVVFSDFDVVEPDLIFIPTLQANIVTERNIQGAPGIVIEVMSDPVMDRRRKKALYARYKVPEYWIVDPAKGEVEIYLLAGEDYAEPMILTAGDDLTTDQLPGFVFKVGELTGL